MFLHSGSSVAAHPRRALFHPFPGSETDVVIPGIEARKMDCRKRNSCEVTNIGWFRTWRTERVTDCAEQLVAVRLPYYRQTVPGS
jgi:hypothetical protein